MKKFFKNYGKYFKNNQKTSQICENKKKVKKLGQCLMFLEKGFWGKYSGTFEKKRLNIVRKITNNNMKNHESSCMLMDKAAFCIQKKKKKKRAVKWEIVEKCQENV